MLLDDILAPLQADDELMELLTGGIYTAMEISRQLTPDAFDVNGELLPCGLLKTGNETKIGPYLDSVQTPIAVYLYQSSGYAAIEAADLLIFELLNNQKKGAATWLIEFDGTNSRQYDDALQCPMLVSRFHATRRKI